MPPVLERRTVLRTIYRDYVSANSFKRTLHNIIEFFTDFKTGKDVKSIKSAAEYEKRQMVGFIMEKYGDTIYRAAYAYLHNCADAEDIVQDTLIKYLQSRQTFETEAHEKAWILKVAVNLSKNKIDYNKIRQAEELDENLPGNRREDLSFIWDEIKKLPKNQTMAIHLFYYEGLSTKEIAKILNVNESTFRSYLKRGRDKLRENLKEDFDFE